MNSALLDSIKTVHGELHGVVDSITTKHIIFIDLTMNTDPEVIKIVTMWRLYYTHMRFGVFKEMFFQSREFGRQVLINKKSVVSDLSELNAPARPKRRSTKVTIRSQKHASDSEQPRS